GYLAGKFLRRYKVALATAGCILALIVGSVAYTLIRITAERNEAVAARRQAELSFDEARQTVDEFLTEMSREGLKDVPGVEEMRPRSAELAAAGYEAFVARRPDDTAVIEGQARSLAALGAITGQVGSLNKAVAALERAIDINRQLVEKEPDVPEHRFRLAQT